MSRLRQPRHVWPRVLRSGLLLWTVVTAATQLSGDPTLVPAVILLGSFLVPVTCVVAAWEHRRTDVVGTPLILRTVVLGGGGAVAIAAMAERALLRPGPFVYLAIGVIEETAKLAALLWCTRALPRRSARDGLVLGAGVGFGFAALESAGYAFNALFTPAGLSLGALLDNEVLRALLAPFGHGLWTGVLGAAWFAAFPRPLRHARAHRRSTSARPASAVVAFAVWAFVVLLHAAFDAMPAVVTAMAGTAGTHLYAVGLLAVIGCGLLSLLGTRRYVRRQEARRPHCPIGSAAAPERPATLEGHL